MDEQTKPFKSGLERAMLDFDMFRDPRNAELQQRAAKIDAQYLKNPSRLFALARSIGSVYFAFADERYHPFKAKHYTNSHTQFQ